MIHFRQILGSSAEERQACMALNLVHELTHTFQMYDVYTNPEHELNSQRCVMHYYSTNNAPTHYTAVQNDTKEAFCDSCTTTLELLTQEISIEGNQ